eukprot:EG_transcript_28682
MARAGGVCESNEVDPTFPSILPSPLQFPLKRGRCLPDPENHGDASGTIAFFGMIDFKPIKLIIAKLEIMKLYLPFPFLPPMLSRSFKREVSPVSFASFQEFFFCPTWRSLAALTGCCPPPTTQKGEASDHRQVSAQKGLQCIRFTFGQ